MSFEVSRLTVKWIEDGAALLTARCYPHETKRGSGCYRWVPGRKNLRQADLGMELADVESEPAQQLVEGLAADLGLPGSRRDVAVVLSEERRQVFLPL